MSTRRINDLLNLAHVTHWHSVPTLRKPSVAEHSFRVAVIVMELCDKLSYPSLGAIQWALCHDGPETETGDLPHTAKAKLDRAVWDNLEAMLCPWYNKPADYLTGVKIVKVADLTECYIFICQNAWPMNIECRNAEVALRDQLNAAIDAAGIKGLNEAVYAIIGEYRLPSDTRHT